SRRRAGWRSLVQYRAVLRGTPLEWATAEARRLRRPDEPDRSDGLCCEKIAANCVRSQAGLACVSQDTASLVNVLDDVDRAAAADSKWRGSFAALRGGGFHPARIVADDRLAVGKVQLGGIGQCGRSRDQG